MFIGTKSGIENKLVENAGFKIKHISTGKLLRELTLKNFKAKGIPFKFVRIGQEAGDIEEYTCHNSKHLIDCTKLLQAMLVKV